MPIVVPGGAYLTLRLDTPTESNSHVTVLSNRRCWSSSGCTNEGVFALERGTRGQATTDEFAHAVVRAINEGQWMVVSIPIGGVEPYSLYSYHHDMYREG